MLLIVRIKVFVLPTAHFLSYVWKISEFSTQITQRQIIQNFILWWMTYTSDFKNSEVCEIHPIFPDTFSFLLYQNNSAYSDKTIHIQSWFFNFGAYWPRFWGSAALQLTLMSFSRATPSQCFSLPQGGSATLPPPSIYRNQIRHDNQWVTEELPDIKP